MTGSDAFSIIIHVSWLAGPGRLNPGLNRGVFAFAGGKPQWAERLLFPFRAEGSGCDVTLVNPLWSPHEAGRSSAWLERLVRDQEAAGSNPVAPIASDDDTSCRMLTFANVFKGFLDACVSAVVPSVVTDEDTCGHEKSPVITTGSTTGRAVSETGRSSVPVQISAARVVRSGSRSIAPVLSSSMGSV